MKTFTTEHVYDYPFPTLAKAVWRKYPNPLKPEVLGTDIIKRNLDADGALVSERIIHSLFSLPSWSQRILGNQGSVQYVYEKSRLEPKSQCMSAWSRNITHARTVTVGETITYRGRGDGTTLLTQESTVEVHLPFSGYLEQIIVDNISNNSLKGAEALEWAAKLVSDEEKKLIPVDYTNGFGYPTPLVTAAGNTLPHGQTAVAVVDDWSGKAIVAVDDLSDKALKSVTEITDLSDKARKSVSEITDRAKKSVDDLSERADIGGQAIIKSIDEISEKTIKSIDEISEKTIKSIDVMSEKTIKSIDEMSEKTIKSIDVMSDGAVKSLSKGMCPRALRCYRIFDDLFNLC